MSRHPLLVTRHPYKGFTLIELLIVIAVIAVLASLIFPITAALNRRKQLTLAQAQLQALSQDIEGYKTKLGFYPPDNTNNPSVNPLYFELLGTTNDGLGGTPPQNYVTMDGSAQISAGATSPNVLSVFSIAGFANTATRAHSDDRGAAATTFLNNVPPTQVGQIDPIGAPQIKILVCPVQWPDSMQPALSTTTYPNAPHQLNPWNYVSSHPTNNASTFDLWVDVVIKNKTNRICNWSAQPIQL